MTTIGLDKYKRIVQYFWDPEPANDTSSRSPIWCLGRRYTILESQNIGGKSSQRDHDVGNISASAAPRSQPATPPDSKASSVDSALVISDSGNDDGGGWPTAFLDDFESKIWLTYRSNFPAIPKSKDSKAPSSMSLSVRIRSQLVDQAGFTSDTGWGCMIRSGQSLLANSLTVLRMGRDWRRGQSSTKELELLSMFADDPRAPFSIHKFVEHGASACGKHPGEWFGPSATAHCIQALTNKYVPSELRVYITGDGSDVYEDAFMRTAKLDGTFKPTLILVGTRLGLDQITPVYWEALSASLQMSQSIGIAGGRPASSHYFVGVQGQYFFYLDPHQTRPAIPLPGKTGSYSQEQVDSFHTRRLRRIHVGEMDPSMLIAFLIRSEDDWRDWRRAVQEVQGKPIVHIADREPTLHTLGSEREEALDEVESFDDTDDDDTVFNA